MKAEVYSAAFAVFWDAYPRHVGKGAAWRAWLRLEVTSTDLGQMLAALDWQKTTRQWTADAGAFIPHPSTWLNQRRFEDEPSLELVPRPKSLGPIYTAWDCPHQPSCQDRRHCALVTAKASA